MATTRLSPERQELLSAAELDYIRGVMVEGLDDPQWPSYQELADKYDLPVAFVERQGAKHNWYGRRDIQRNRMFKAKNLRARREIELQYKQVAETLNRIGVRQLMTVGLMSDRYHRTEKLARDEQEAMQSAGDSLAIASSDLRPQQMEALARATAQIAKTLTGGMEVALGRTNAMPDVAAEEVEDSTTEANLASLEAVLREMNSIQAEANGRNRNYDPEVHATSEDSHERRSASA